MALADLLRTRTREQVVQRMLFTLGADPALGGNFAPTNYVPGDPLRTLLELQGEGVADVERTVSALADAGYLDRAPGEWLSLLTESHYGITRQPSTFAQGMLRLVASAAGAISVPPGLIVGTASGLKYSTLEAGTVPAGGYLDLPIRAEQPGSAYNVPAGTINVLHTPLPGLAVTNVAGWLLEAGADEESDEALRRRARLRWSELGGGATRDAYEYWALSAHPSVDRVRILDEHPRGQGTLDVVVWGTGGIGPDVIAAVDEFVQPRRPVTADVRVYAATERVVPVTLELYAPWGDRASIAAEVQRQLALLQQGLDIGGTLYRAQIIEAAMLPAGMLDVRTELPDVRLDPTEALTLAPTLTWRSAP